MSTAIFTFVFCISCFLFFCFFPPFLPLRLLYLIFSPSTSLQGLFVCLLGSHLRMEVPRLGVESGAAAASLQHRHSNTGSLTHRAGPGIQTSFSFSWMLVRFVTTEPQRELQFESFMFCFSSFVVTVQSFTACEIHKDLRMPLPLSTGCTWYPALCLLFPSSPSAISVLYHH